MVKLTFERDIFGNPKAIYHVETIKAKTAYMTVKRMGSLDDRRAVVIVNSSKLLKIWKNQPSSIEILIANGNEEIWRQDKKFANAEKVFSKGIKNPVWLANVNCRTEPQRRAIYKKKFFFLTEHVGFEETNEPNISFNGGRTRTIWLLANGTKRFPVECPLDEASLLASCASSDQTFLTVAQIYAEQN